MIVTKQNLINVIRSQYFEQNFCTIYSTDSVNGCKGCKFSLQSLCDTGGLFKMLVIFLIYKISRMLKQLCAKVPFCVSFSFLYIYIYIYPSLESVVSVTKDILVVPLSVPQNPLHYTSNCTKRCPAFISTIKSGNQLTNS